MSERCAREARYAEYTETTETTEYTETTENPPTGYGEGHHPAGCPGTAQAR